jgi:hypothetical protein
MEHETRSAARIRHIVRVADPSDEPVLIHTIGSCNEVAERASCEGRARRDAPWRRQPCVAAPDVRSSDREPWRSGRGSIEWFVDRDRQRPVDGAAPGDRVRTEPRDLLVDASARAQVVEQRLLGRARLSEPDGVLPGAQLVRVRVHDSPLSLCASVLWRVADHRGSDGSSSPVPPITGGRCRSTRRPLGPSLRVDSVLDDGAVRDQEDEHENRQCRNWPDHV